MTAVAGGLVAVFAFAFASPTASWLTLAMAIAVTLVALTVFAASGVGTFARLLSFLLAALGGWTIVAVRAFDDPRAVKWISFASGAAFAGLGCVGLVGHELARNRSLRRSKTVAQPPVIHGRTGRHVNGANGRSGGPPFAPWLPDSGD